MLIKMRLGVMLSVVMLGGCNWYYNTLPSPDDALKLVPFFDHMVKSPAPSPYQRADIPRNTVPGTVPINKVDRDWQAEWARGITTTVDTLTNLAAGSDALLARGDTLYHVYCAVCHGPAGGLGGTVSARVGAPSLLTERARGYTDGYLYSIIRYGRGVMGRYGDKIHRPLDRWAVVTYVRQLQTSQPLVGGAN